MEGIITGLIITALPGIRVLLHFGDRGRIMFAVCFSSIVIIRMMIAWFLKEQSKVWLFYICLCASFALWVPLMTGLYKVIMIRRGEL